MINISDFLVDRIIHQSQNTIVFQGKKVSSDTRVVVKTINSEYPDSHLLEKIEHEYQILKELDFAGVPKAYSIEKNKNSLAILMEDFGGSPLESIVSYSKINTKDFLGLAIKIIEILDFIHKKSVIHKDLNPSNILWNYSDDIVKIIDFGISSKLSSVKEKKINSQVDGTLAYISPEQTGRMNKAVDYRTDFYSLGITFYELLNGELPFYSEDPSEYVHFHIAKKPIPLSKINNDIPEALSNIVMKMLEKMPEQRYQSCSGIIHDLLECKNQLNSTGKIEKFKLGTNDLYENFRLPDQIYGREHEREKLLSIFDNVSESSTTSVVLVGGYSGIGKTSLINEIHKPIVEKRGYFISGKFDQFKRNIPYSSIIQALEDFVREILTKEENEIEHFKERILNATGVNSQIIIDVIPNVELIIGKQPNVPTLPQEESQNRFNRVFINFIRCFAEKNHPLVIFLDDIQWADSASINLLELLITDLDTTYIMFIGAYRDNEVNEKDLFLITMKNIENSGTPLQKLILKPLEAMQVMQLIGDTLKANEVESSSLAKLCHRKTQGNPFFLNQFLISLYDEKLITYDNNEKKWKWDIDLIQKAEMTDNVVDLMIGRIRKLSTDAQNILKLAACIGNQFSLKTISLVENLSLSKIAELILEAIREGLIVSFKGIITPSTLDSIDLNNEEDIPICKFAHDRIQQAAYSMIEEEKKGPFHHKIYCIMVAHLSEKEINENIFDIVNQLQFCTELITEKEEKLRAANVLYKAGKKASESMAYEPSYNYFMICISFLEKNNWADNYELTFKIYLETAKAAYLNGNFEIMEKLAEDILNNSKNLLEKIQVYKLKIYAYIAYNKPHEAVNTGLHALKLLGVTFPKNASKLHIAKEILKTKVSFINKEPEEVLSLPQAKDPIALAINEILAETGTAAFFSNPNLFPLIGLGIVHTSLKSGNSSDSCLGYGTYGIMLCGILNDIEQGYRFGKAALANSQQFKDNNKTVYIELVFTVFIKHWKCHVRETLETIIANYNAGMESGDIKNAAISAYVYIANSFISGCRLQDIEFEAESYRKIFLQHQQKISYNYSSIYLQSARNLMGKSDSKTLLISPEFDENERILFHNEEYDGTALGLIYYNKLLLAYLFGDFKLALENSIKFNTYIDALLSTTLILCHNFLDSLIRLSLLSECTASKKKEHMKFVEKNQKKLKKWAEVCPQNNLHRWYLVEAEIARARSKIDKAITFYDKAVMSASENDYINEEAIANELAAKFFITQGMTKIARHYINDAYYCYERWGAYAKANDIKDKYFDLMNKTGDSTDHKSSISSQTKTNAFQAYQNTTSNEFSDNTLDLNSFIKAASVITGEIVLENLLTNLMRILIENAGADKGVLILKKDGEYFIEAEGRVSSNEVSVLQSIPISVSNSIPEKMIKYVCRVRENLVINDVLNDQKFNNDKYIQKQQPKSILCAPLIHKGNLIGAYYLENNLISGAFTNDRLNILQLLSSQIAISIDNASLYEKVTEYNKTLEDKVKERTSELTQAYKKIEQLALTDPLTKLSNRRHILDRIDHEIKKTKRNNKPFGVILCDIDHFKEFNDSFGHDCGDFVLVSIAKIIYQMIRNQDHISRWGGEEFLLILPDTDLKGSGFVAEKIRQNIAEENFVFNGQNLSVTMTLGVTIFDNTLAIDECIKNSDTALYEGKEKGRNQVVVFRS